MPTTFKNPLVEQLVNAIFTNPEDRKFLMKGTCMLPTNKEMLDLTEKRLQITKESFAAIQKEVEDLTLMINLAKIIDKITDGAQGDDLVEFHKDAAER